MNDVNERVQGRTYELRLDEWVEIDPQPRPRSLLRRLAALLSSAFAIAVIFAIGVVVAGLALVLLPLALLIETRRPR
jgi:hypothetical protein